MRNDLITGSRLHSHPAIKQPPLFEGEAAQANILSPLRNCALATAEDRHKTTPSSEDEVPHTRLIASQVDGEVRNAVAVDVGVDEPDAFLLVDA